MCACECVCVRGVCVCVSITTSPLQSFYYYQTPYPANMYWMIFVVTGVSLGIGTTIGVAILFTVQVTKN